MFESDSNTVNCYVRRNLPFHAAFLYVSCTQEILVVIADTQSIHSSVTKGMLCSVKTHSSDTTNKLVANAVTRVRPMPVSGIGR